MVADLNLGLILRLGLLNLVLRNISLQLSLLICSALQGSLRLLLANHTHHLPSGA
tara:strand:+ start:786 stop:950 length:165 start_codon:yes stop_codon:yes gene_type:complete